MVKSSVKDLTSAALLVAVSVSKWGNRKVEKELSEKTAKDQEAEGRMFHTTKRLVSMEVVFDVNSAFRAFKRYYHRNTLPWADTGYRLLPAANFAEFTAEANKLREAALKEVDAFLKTYPTLRERARKALGKAFRETDYPTAAALRTRWAAEMHFMPIPNTADIRIDVPKKELDRISADINGEVKEALKRATTDMFERLYSVVLSMRDRLKDYKVVTDEDGEEKVENAFRDSVVTNLQDICALLPKLNVMEDPHLTALVAEVSKTLANQEPEVLRDNDDQRAKTIAKANAVLDKMADYVGADVKDAA